MMESGYKTNFFSSDGKASDNQTVVEEDKSSPLSGTQNDIEASESDSSSEELHSPDNEEEINQDVAEGLATQRS